MSLCGGGGCVGWWEGGWGVGEEAGREGKGKGKEERREGRGRSGVSRSVRPSVCLCDGTLLVRRGAELFWARQETSTTTTRPALRRATETPRPRESPLLFLFALPSVTHWVHLLACIFRLGPSSVDVGSCGGSGLARRRTPLRVPAILQNRIYRASPTPAT